MDNTWFQIEIWHRYYPDLAYNAFYIVLIILIVVLMDINMGLLKILNILAYLNENTIEKQSHP